MSEKHSRTASYIIDIIVGYTIHVVQAEDIQKYRINHPDHGFYKKLTFRVLDRRVEV